MATNRTTDKVTVTEPDTTEAKPFSFARLFNRNGHEKQPAAPVKPQGPPKSVMARILRVGSGDGHHGVVWYDFHRAGSEGPHRVDAEHDHDRRSSARKQIHLCPGKSLPFLPQREIKRGDIIVFKYPGNPYDPKRDDRPDNRPILTNYVKRVIGIPGDRIQHQGQQRHC